MALIFRDGFDFYNSSTLQALYGRWTVFNADNGFTTGRFGGGAIINGGSDLYKTVPSQDTYVISRAFKVPNFSANNLVQSFKEGTTSHVELRTDTSGHLVVTRNGTVLATSSRVLTGGAWHHLQMKVKVHSSTGTYEVRVDGVALADLTATGQNTRNGGTGVITRIEFTCSATAVHLDDVLILDTTGAINNDFPGENKIVTIFPTGAGAHTDFTPSAGSNWQNVDDNPEDADTTYNESSSVGAIDTFTATAISGATGILGVGIILTHRKTDAGTREIAAVLRDSVSADHVGATVTLASSYTGSEEFYETDPNTSAAWTQSNVNASQFGYKVIT